MVEYRKPKIGIKRKISFQIQSHIVGRKQIRLRSGDDKISVYIKFLWISFAYGNSTNEYIVVENFYRKRTCSVGG
jgi:hypothetical protein